MIKIKKHLPKNLSWRSFFSKQVIVPALAVTSLIVIGAAIFEKYIESEEDRTFLASGRLVTINDNQSIHLHCSGKGTQTVILESGMSGTSLDWVRVQPEIAKETRVCSYDRPGYGWSDEAKSDRNASTSADELYSVLQKDNIKPPYVMVGASYGGLISRVFTVRHIDEVSALIQVDPSHESDFDLSSDSPGQLSKTDTLTSVYLSLELAKSYFGITRANSIANYTNDDIRTKEQVGFLSSSKNFRTMLREYNALTKSTTIARDEASSLKSLKTKYILTSQRFDRQKKFCNISTSCIAQDSGSNDHLIPQNNPDIVISSIREALGGS
ncbi:MAG: alpha/beta hydrolase [Chloroflexi bacterium]|nr:MAG: alpha/beta hydrolase [Chloroflexota bacterium]